MRVAPCQFRLARIALFAIIFAAFSARAQAPREFSFAGHVNAEAKPLLAGVQVELRSVGPDHLIQVAETDSAGDYLLCGLMLQDGSYELRFSLSGYEPSVRRIEVKAETATETTINVALEPRVGLAEKGAGYITRVTVFYATDREASGKGKATTYLASASRQGLQFGSVAVTIPSGHKPGNIEEPTIFKFEFSSDPEWHFTLTVNPAGKNDFFSSLGNAIATRTDKDAFVFIHGYCNSFEDAIKRAAQLSFDLQVGGIPIVYSWPSQDTFRGYFQDERAAEATKANFKAFLKDLQQRSGARAIYLVAHSMGNRVLLPVLAELASESKGKLLQPFQQVVMAAADMKRDDFVQNVNTLLKFAPHLTMYISKHDHALALSRYFHHGETRVGDANPVLVVKGLDTIDISQVDYDYIGHSYLAENVAVIRDLAALLRNQLPPRALRDSLSAEGRYWVLTPP